MIVVEMQAATDAAGTLQTFYLSSDGYSTSLTDTPPNTFLNPVLIDPATIGISAFSDGRTGGATKLESGEIVLANADGALDSWSNYSFDGRPVIIRSGTRGGAYPASFLTVMTGTVEDVTHDWRKVVIRLRDKQFYLDKPALTVAYAGNNSLPNGLEGTPNDVGGKLKPKVYGKVFNIEPAFVNTSKLTYQVHQGIISDITAVYDRGLALTKGADYATSALLQAATPAASTYITCFAEGYFRLGSSPAGMITCDVVQGATAADRTAAQILKKFATDAGLTSGEISSGDITALDTDTSAVVGIYLNAEETTFSAAMDEIAASVGAWYGFDALGVLRMGRLTAPTTSAVTTLTTVEIQEGIERRAPNDTNIPSWRSVVNHSKIYAVQDSDLAGAVTDVRKAYLSNQYRTSKSEDATIKTQWLLSDQITYDTLLTSSSDADTEATRRLNLYKVKRDVFDVPVNLSVYLSGNGGNQLKMLDVIQMTINRFGCDAGRYFRLIGYRIELKTETVILTIWG